jgi:hypothetical protein
LIPAWQLKVNPVRVRLRELLSILLAAEIAMHDGIISSSSCPSGGSLIAPVTARMSVAPRVSLLRQRSIAKYYQAEPAIC